MVIVDVRRHAESAQHGDGAGALSSRGAESARALASHATYARVLSSPRPRARETALAIGGRVDEVISGLDVASDEVLTQAQYDGFRTWSALSDWLSTSLPSRQWAETQLGLWAAVANRLSEGERALIVTHGANVELPAALLVARRRAELTGPLPFEPLSGVRVIYEQAQIAGIQRLNSSTREISE